MAIQGSRFLWGIMDALKIIIKQAQETIETAQDLAALEQLRVHYLGKKGEITALLKTLGTLPESEHPQAGQLINQAKDLIENNLQNRRQFLETQQLNQELARDTIDVTLPRVSIINKAACAP